MESTKNTRQEMMPMHSNERLAEKIAREYIVERNFKSILDVGCGDGIVSDHISENCLYLGLDINEACIYEKRHDNPNVQYIQANKIPEIMDQKGPWDAILLLDVLEHTKEFSDLFAKAIKNTKRCVIVSLPNELFFLDRLRMVLGKELNAHSLDRLKDPEGFKHQYIINIDKAKVILSEIAQKNNFYLESEVVRPLISKNKLLQPALWLMKTLSSTQVWSMGSVLIYSKE